MTNYYFGCSPTYGFYLVFLLMTWMIDDTIISIIVKNVLTSVEFADLYPPNGWRHLNLNNRWSFSRFCLVSSCPSLADFLRPYSTMSAPYCPLHRWIAGTSLHSAASSGMERISPFDCFSDEFGSLQRSNLGEKASAYQPCFRYFQILPEHQCFNSTENNFKVKKTCNLKSFFILFG